MTSTSNSFTSLICKSSYKKRRKMNLLSMHQSRSIRALSSGLLKQSSISLEVVLVADEWFQHDISIN